MVIWNKVILSAALIAIVAAPMVHGHGEATGVVKERMDLMNELKQSMKTLGRMLKGEIPYDAGRASEAAAVLEAKGGEVLTKAFPKDSIHGPSEARPEIWQDWQRFESLAEKLRRYGDALKEAAGEGLRTAAGTMGVGGKKPINQPSGEQLTQMPAEKLFRMVGRTCSGCHEHFRVKKDE